jgi:hypothetical protein
VIKIALAFLLIMTGCASLNKAQRADVPPTVSFSRYLMISTCLRTEKVCRDPVAKNLEQANISVPFVDGVAQSSVTLIESNLNFTGDVTITAKENAYQVDLKLSSGNGDKRREEKHSFSVSNLNEFSETTLMNQPIPFNKGILRAQLVFGPLLIISK